jgi:hypothetical protein
VKIRFQSLLFKWVNLFRCGAVVGAAGIALSLFAIVTMSTFTVGTQLTLSLKALLVRFPTLAPEM